MFFSLRPTNTIYCHNTTTQGSGLEQIENLRHAEVKIDQKKEKSFKKKKKKKLESLSLS